MIMERIFSANQSLISNEKAFDRVRALRRLNY